MNGDIIEFSYDMFIGNFNTFVAKGVVVFEEGSFYVELFENERTTKDEAYLLYSINLDTIEVIGNIYDNTVMLDVIFRNGYNKNSPQIKCKCIFKGKGQGKEEWGAVPGQRYYVLKILEIVEVSNDN